MKKLLSIAFVAAMLFSCVAAAVPVSAVISGEFEGFNYEVNDDGTTATLVYYNETQRDVVIPSVIDGYKITGIGHDAFYRTSGIESVIIPEGITSIGYYAFHSCKSLESITIPEGVTSIGYGAFTFCESLKSVSIPEGVTSIESRTFWGCSSLESVTIPDSVTTIKDDAFWNCTSLKNVTIPAGVESIGYGVFNNCISLTSFYTDINNEYYSSENGVLFNKDKTTLVKYPGGNTRKSYIIPDGVTSIGIFAFDDCTSLTDVTIPDSVTYFISGPFDECTSLETINVDTNNKYYSSEDGVLFSKDKTVLIQYPICKTGTNYIIPDSVTNIDNSAFNGCTSLECVTIPNGVTSIGNGAFSGCRSLESITIPNGVASIGTFAFDHCKSLTSITIPKSVTKIYDDAFSGCDKLVIYGYSGTAAEKYASDNSITFIPLTDLVDSESNVTVSGVIPEGTQLVVDILSTTDTRVTYNITLLQNGEEILPEGAVTVKIPVPAGMNGAECLVYSEDEFYSYTDMNADFQDGFMVFSTDYLGKFVLSSRNLENIGDLTSDGIVTLKDVLIARKYVAGVSSLTEKEISRGDINGDGELTLKDILIMRRMVAGLL